MGTPIAGWFMDGFRENPIHKCMKIGEYTNDFGNLDIELTYLFYISNPCLGSPIVYQMFET